MGSGEGTTGRANVIYNFAIGSNVNTERLRTRARWLGDQAEIKFLSAEPAVLRGYRIVFNTPGFPPAEAAFCSVRACECGGGRRCPSEVHGVLYAFDRASYELLWVTEGGLGGREYGSSYVERRVHVETYRRPGVLHEAIIFETRPSRTVETWYRRWLRRDVYRRRWLASEFRCIATSAMGALEQELAAQRVANAADQVASTSWLPKNGSAALPLWYTQHAHVLEVTQALPQDHSDRIALELERVLIRPSMRYLGLIRDGALQSGLDADYRRLLETYMVHWRVSCPCAARPQPLQGWLTVSVNMSTPGFFRWLWWAHLTGRKRVLRFLYQLWNRWFLRVLSFFAMERELHAMRLAQRTHACIGKPQVLLHWVAVYFCSVIILIWTLPIALAGLLYGRGNFFHVRASTPALVPGNAAPAARSANVHA
ncbi:hypothetical protein CYME_CMM057C [Cyanidioschyzon merolae strain 10D]|uniref:gamma-glutamylcyclotransferase n=1 Tax=Cyanidioschyzon merolae (strain NIES-3377 / 10D) TaxID=280699 RepID=M1VIJ7_CYAM1|nr:hypothetical protein CYME_CMM057C [Cyanidioschyzon merolae strain 10D]BAM80943.1 hypothetical protein CYME_CMM057C [Cyanidioschyzon merolae strain 10D]|eukprot:XP_005536979.1 hypothetical protein CYME_CMM057C [Cyanidioschyzon merolae strain 10D]